MGNTGSLTKGGNSKERNELKLDDILDEVQDVSGLILVIVQTIKQHKQLGPPTDNKEAKNILEGLLKDAFGRLQYYFTIDVYTTCQERNDKDATLLEKLNTTEKGTQLLTKAGLSDADIKNVFERVKDLKNRSIVNIAHLGEQVKMFSTIQPKSISSQNQFSRENSNTDCCDQQQPHSEKEKVHEENNDHSFRKVRDTRTQTDSTTKRVARDEFGNYRKTDGTMSRTAKNEAGNGTIRDNTKHHSVSGDTELLKLSGNCQRANSTMKGIPGNRPDTNSSDNSVFEHNPREPKEAGKRIYASNEEINKEQCRTGDKLIPKLTTKDDDWTQLNVCKDETQTIKPTTNDHTKETERLQGVVKLLNDTNEALKIENENLKKKQIQKINSYSANEVAKQKTDIKTQQREILSLKEENEKLLLRLSKLAGEKLTKDNPNITDLSDPNRPTKLGEIHSELYDNEWTDAYEGLSKAGYQETEAIRVLSITLKNAYKFCAKNATDMLMKTENVAMQLFAECKKSQMSVCQSVVIPNTQTNDESGQFSHIVLEEHFIERHWKPKQRTASVQTGGRRQSNRQMVGFQSQEVVKPTKMEGELVKLRKEVSLSMVPVVQQAYLRGKWDETCIEPLKPYIQKCVFLCWMMVVQSPPMVFDKNTAEGTRFESALYKQYTKTGDVLEYVVWPALLLHEGGAIVCKGVAQPKKAKDK